MIRLTRLVALTFLVRTSKICVKPSNLDGKIYILAKSNTDLKELNLFDTLPAQVFTTQKKNYKKLN